MNSVSFSGRTYPHRGDGIVGRGQSRQGSAGRQDGAEGRHWGGGRRDRRPDHRQSTKATVIGGAAGAAAGAATAAATANYQGCIDAGGSIVLTLTAPATVKA